MDKNSVQRVGILGSKHFFKPAHIVVKVNKPVEQLDRKDGYVVPHSIVIEGLRLVSGSTNHCPAIRSQLTFTPTMVVTYPMYCDIKLLFLDSHREKGMEGILEVIE